MTLAQQTMADVANTISEFEPITMPAASADQAGARRKNLDF
jgi:agmatine deiminase